MATFTINTIGTLPITFVNNDLVANAVDVNVEKIYTTINGQWKSWVKGAPDAYQGFINFESGRGYTVVANGTSTITLTDGGFFSFYDIPVVVGYNMISFPNLGIFTCNKTIHHIDVSKMYTIINGVWKSWIDGVPDAYQGFTQVDNTLAYTCKVDIIRQVCSETNYDTSIVDENSAQGVTVTTGGTIGVTTYFNKLIYDPGISPKTGFFDANGLILKIDYAIEYDGAEFLVIYNGAYLKGNFVDTGTFTAPTPMTICREAGI